jgi:hypothetical protein
VHTIRFEAFLQPGRCLAGTPADQQALQAAEHKLKDKSNRQTNVSSLCYVTQRLTPACECCPDVAPIAVTRFGADDTSSVSLSRSINANSQQQTSNNNNNAAMAYLGVNKKKLERRRPPDGQFKVALKPYQEQALWWMMQRECGADAVLDRRFVELHDADGNQLYVHRDLDIVWLRAPMVPVTGRGGILGLSSFFFPLQSNLSNVFFFFFLRTNINV